MRNLLEKWNYLYRRSPDHFKSSTLLLHHIIQFTAITGKYLTLNDEGHINNLVEWHPEKNVFLGRWIDSKYQPLRVGIKLPHLRLLIYTPPSRIVNYLDIQGRNKTALFEWLRWNLSKYGVDIQPLDMEMPYEIPQHYTDNGGIFTEPSRAEISEISAVRSNAHHILSYFARSFKQHNIIIDPESFHTELYLPVFKKNARKISFYIKLGLSVPDSYIDHYYFYLKHFPSGDTIDYYFKLRKLKGGGYWRDLDQLTAVLPVNELYGNKYGEEQAVRVLYFYKSALENSYELLTNNLISRGDIL